MLTILLNVKMMINYNMSMLGLLLITIIYQVGDTPLHWAARGALDTAKLLIENGAHMNATNNVQVLYLLFFLLPYSHPCIPPSLYGVHYIISISYFLLS